MEPTSKEILARLTEALNCKTDAVPPGFKTRAQWQKEWGCSPSHAKKLINAGIEAGLIEVRKYRVMQTQGACPTPHYGPTSSGKKARDARIG